LKGDEAVVLLRSEMDTVKLLKNGESETVEFKAQLNKEAIVSLAVLANTKGGKVISEYPGVSYSISETGDFFKVEMRHTPTKTTIKPPLETPLKTEIQDVYLAELEDEIFMQIQIDSHIAFENIAANLSISRNTVKEYDDKLKNKRVLRRVGGRRGGHWEILWNSMRKQRN